ncbi:hypothetical protein L1987_80873 [Smallanthus sonchifolius]|uniref:Uncharacterized protein n=1 Tax=Smallanthus sonchifolius TaxID=185202 RepID=A0ACB8YQ44_9ASTR|nr:hypothetical protein L1987_80873 [Smallanthus sonchifolius]
MAPSTDVVILERLNDILKIKLDGTSFLKWYYNLRKVLGYNKKMHVLKFPVPEQPPRNAGKFERYHQDYNKDPSYSLMTYIKDEVGRIRIMP